MKRAVALLGLMAVLAGCGMAQMAAPMPQGGVGAQAIILPGDYPKPGCPSPNPRPKNPSSPKAPSPPKPPSLPKVPSSPKTNAILPPGYRPGC